MQPVFCRLQGIDFQAPRERARRQMERVETERVKAADRAFAAGFGG